MKIAMIGHKRIPSREGGVEIVVEALSRRMVQRGHQVTVYNRKSHHVAGTAFDDHSHLHNLDGVQIRWVPTPNSKKLNAIVYSFFATVRALFGGYDIIHFHAEGPAAMVPLAKCFGKNAWSPFMAWTGGEPNGAALPPAFSALASVWPPSMQTRSSCCLPVCKEYLLTPITARPCGLKTALTHRRRRTCPLCPDLDWKRTAISCFSVALSRRRASTI